MLWRNDWRKKELLDTFSEQARYRKVNATFEVSAESLQRLASDDPSVKAAPTLLDILAFVDRQDVPEEMFLRAWKYEEEVLSEFEVDDGPEKGFIEDLTPWHVAHCRSAFPYLPLNERTQLFRKARAHLHRLSLVSFDQDEKSMSVHSLVHAWARGRVPRPGEAWLAVASLLALSVEGSWSWQQFTSRLVRHHETSFSIWQDMGSVALHQYGLCKIWCVYAWQLYRASSVRTIEMCLQFLEHAQGLTYQQSDQLPVTEAQYLMGAAYQQNGQIPEAVDMLEHVVKVREKLEEEDPVRLASQRALAGARQTNGQITEAVEMLEHVVKLKEKLEEDDPSRLASQHDLAAVYMDNGQIANATALLEHVLKVNEKLEENHPSRLSSQHELARAYIANGQILKAVKLLEHVVKVGETTLRENHPSRPASQHALASAYLTNGRVPEAVKLLEHVVKVEGTTLHKHHPRRLSSQHELACAYDADGQTSASIELLKRVVDIRQRTLRKDHPDRIVSEKVLADILEEEQRLSEDEPGDMASAGPIASGGLASTRRSRLALRLQEKVRGSVRRLMCRYV